MSDQETKPVDLDETANFKLAVFHGCNSLEVRTPEGKSFRVQILTFVYQCRCCGLDLRLQTTNISTPPRALPYLQRHREQCDGVAIVSTKT